MSTPRYSIIYASCRPHEIVKHYAMWEQATRNLMDCEFIFAVDELDPASTKMAQEIAEKANAVWHSAKVCIVPAPSRNCIVAWNTAAKMATGSVFMVASDDFVIPAGWDDAFNNLRCDCFERGRVKEPGYWWDHSHVVHTDDGFTSIRHGICTFPIITMEWYRQHGYIYHPSYTELFGDQELCVVGYRDKAMITATQILIEHRHYTNKKRGFDEHDDRHSTREAWNRDQANFNRRKELSFPVVDPPQREYRDSDDGGGAIDGGAIGTGF